jgi:predicted dehydrogenase
MSFSNVTRRRFLQAATGALAVPYFVPGSALGADGGVAASNRITVGSIAAGTRGDYLIRAFSAQQGVQFVAVCDPYQHKRELAKKTIETLCADKAGKGSYKGCQTYNDFRELIARDDIDAVTIASPCHWHAVQAIAALNAGKDVYGEKPLSVTINDGRAMCRAVRRHSRVFQTGTIMRSSPNIRLAGELVQNGYIGKLHTVEVACPGGYEAPAEEPIAVPAGLDYDTWVGPAPMIPYTPHRCENLFGWMLCYNFVLGFISGWGVHHMDMALFALGKDHLGLKEPGPLEVEGTAVFPKAGMNDTPISWKVEYKLASGLKINYSDRDHPYSDGVRFKGDKGWVYVAGGASKIEADPPSLLKVNIKPNEVRLYESRDHVADFIECVRTRRDPVAPVESGHTATTLCNIADIAVRLKRKVVWNPATESFVGDDQANRMRSRPMRGPWTI